MGLPGRSAQNSLQQRGNKMSSVKCRNCGLINFSTEESCRRCGNSFIEPLRSTQEKPPRSFSFVKLLVIAAVAVAAYYIYSSFSTPKGGATSVPPQTNTATQPAGLSRTQYDQQRAGNFANNLKDSPSLAAQRQRDAETKKMMEQASGSSSK